MTREHTRTGAVWHFIITNKEGLSQDVRIKESFGCSDLDMVHFKIVRAGKKMKNKIMTLDHSKTNFGFLKYLPGGTPWCMNLESKGAPRKPVNIEKSLLPKLKEFSIPMNMKLGKNARKHTWISRHSWTNSITERKHKLPS